MFERALDIGNLWDNTFEGAGEKKPACMVRASGGVPTFGFGEDDDFKVSPQKRVWSSSETTRFETFGVGRKEMCISGDDCHDPRFLPRLRHPD